jgi:hypothetical protein
LASSSTGIAKFAREFKHHHPDLYERISKDLIRRSVEGDGAFTHTAPSVSKAHLPNMAARRRL